MPVCQHRKAVSIITKMSEGPVGGPSIRCRAGRGHPPTIEYQWTFVPEPPADPDTRRVGRLEPDESVYGGRPAREMDALLTGTAVQGSSGGGGGTSYTFTTSTPVLKSYVSAVTAAASASYNGARPDFLHGRLECRAVNEMGVQNRPCVYRISGKTLQRFNNNLRP